MAFLLCVALVSLLYYTILEKIIRKNEREHATKYFLIVKDISLYVILNRVISMLRVVQKF